MRRCVLVVRTKTVNEFHRVLHIRFVLVILTGTRTNTDEQSIVRRETRRYDEDGGRIRRDEHRFRHERLYLAASAPLASDVRILCR